MRKKLFYLPKKITPVHLSVNIFMAYVLPHFLYFAPIATMKTKIMEKLEEMYLKTIKKFLFLKKHHKKDNLYRITAIPPLQYWGEYLKFNIITKIKTKTNHDNAILNEHYD